MELTARGTESPVPAPLFLYGGRMFWTLLLALVIGFISGLVFVYLCIFGGLTPTERYYLSEFYRQLREGEFRSVDDDED